MKTHTTGTLRSNRKGNPKSVTAKDLKPGQHVWQQYKSVYVSKWRDKRPVLMITTAYQPKVVEVQNKYKVKKNKPIEVANYNENMSGVDRADQMIAYYSCPRKTIRWYKKVMYHLLDLAIHNAHFLYETKSKMSFLDFRNSLIKQMIQLDIKHGKELGGKRQSRDPSPTPGNGDETPHYQERIPPPAGWTRSSSYFLRCKQCYKDNKKRKQTSFRCKDCPTQPALCPGKCFETWHKAQ
jgi:hypothetical protein